jgi:hypothetical protein
MTTRRKEQIAHNESVFRSMNETLEEHVKRRRSASDLAGFVCECGDAECEAIIRLDLTTYEQIRADSQRFLVVPGHEIADAEDVVQREDGYLLVRKHEDVAPIAEAGDARHNG